MWLEILIAIIILGFALLIKQMEESSREFKKPFMIIIGIFLALYLGASIFLFYRMKPIEAIITTSTSLENNSARIIDQEIVPIDLSTGP